MLFTSNLLASTEKTVFRVNIAQLVPLGFLPSFVVKDSLWERVAQVFCSQMPFVSPIQQCKNTDGIAIVTVSDSISYW